MANEPEEKDGNKEVQEEETPEKEVPTVALVVNHDQCRMLLEALAAAQYPGKLVTIAASTIKKVTDGYDDLRKRINPPTK